MMIENKLTSPDNAKLQSLNIMASFIVSVIVSIFFGKVVLNFDWSLETLLILMHYALGVWVLCNGINFIFCKVVKIPSVSLLLSSSIVIGYFVFDLFHFFLFREHVGFEELSLALLGVISNEFSWTQYASVIALSLMVLYHNI